MSERRVVVTGIGAVSAIGHNIEQNRASLKAGRHGIDVIKSMDIEGQKVIMGAEVKDFEYEDKREAKRLDFFAQFGLTAAKEAIEMSGLIAGENIDPHRIGSYVGSGIGGIRTFETESNKVREKASVRGVSALLVPMLMGNILPAMITIKNGYKGSSIDIVSACASSTHSVGEAARAIKHGYLDAIVCGGAESTFVPVSFAGFANMKAMNPTTDKDRASIPFDKDRAGFIMGEGAGILMIEELEHAKSRGANILAEAAGYGTSSDAYHITQPSPDGEGAAASMQMALDSAGIRPEDISYINAHGTSTPMNDLYETRAIKNVFAGAAYKIPVSSTKSMTGHMLGAAGGYESVVCVLAITDGIIPPTASYRTPDAELDLDYVTEGARKADVRYTLSNSLGFGGHNGSILFRRYEG
ncbi:MAG: beta-ketoacyl-ACP synthase II [Clostridiales Family XIII bacterium]|jgi:3-oxoacyl-[acyl-carrier-protein] synthase II|nr:beta-ketoacyl-ACP synthase II [Clostridiales Family XIII bacterium]